MKQLVQLASQTAPPMLCREAAAVLRGRRLVPGAHFTVYHGSGEETLRFKGLELTKLIILLLHQGETSSF